MSTVNRNCLVKVKAFELKRVNYARYDFSHYLDFAVNWSNTTMGI